MPGDAPDRPLENLQSARAAALAALQQTCDRQRRAELERRIAELDAALAGASPPSGLT